MRRSTKIKVIVAVVVFCVVLALGLGLGLGLKKKNNNSVSQSSQSSQVLSPDIKNKLQNVSNTLNTLSGNLVAEFYTIKNLDTTSFNTTGSINTTNIDYYMKYLNWIADMTNKINSQMIEIKNIYDSIGNFDDNLNTFSYNKNYFLTDLNPGIETSIIELNTRVAQQGLNMTDFNNIFLEVIPTLLKKINDLINSINAITRKL